VTTYQLQSKPKSNLHGLNPLLTNINYGASYDEILSEKLRKYNIENYRVKYTKKAPNGKERYETLKFIDEIKVLSREDAARSIESDRRGQGSGPGD
jgi:hypothetical protein